jgi:hypothetical protein
MLGVSAMVTGWPLHDVCVAGFGVITGRGLTTAVASSVSPVQPFTVGIIVYVTVTLVVPVFVNVWVIKLPVPVPPWLLLQLN